MFLLRRRAPKVIFHIGLPKCGSSSIQRHFATHDAAYRAQGLVYPETGRERAGYRSHLPLMKLDDADLPAAMAALQAECAGARRVLISCEAFADALPGGRATAMGDALADTFGRRNVTVLSYMRAPLPFVESAYAQFLTGGLFHVPKPAFFAPGAEPGLARFLECAAALKGFDAYDLLGWSRAIADAFPGLALNLRSMAPDDLARGRGRGRRRDLLDDLCAVLKLRRQGTEARHNTRRAASALLAIQHAQLTLPTWRVVQQHALLRDFSLSSAADWPADLRHRDLHVGPDLARRIADRLDRDRAALATRFATPVAGLTARPETPGALSERRLSAAEHAEVLAAFQPG